MTLTCQGCRATVTFETRNVRTNGEIQSTVYLDPTGEPVAWGCPPGELSTSEVLLCLRCFDQELEAMMVRDLLNLMAEPPPPMRAPDYGRGRTAFRRAERN